MQTANIPTLKLWAFSSLALIVAACVAPVRREAAPAPLASYNFEYSITDREAVELIQAFDDGHRTYLQFTHAPGDATQVRAEQNAEPLTGTPDGSYLALNGIYDTLIITAGSHTALVVNQSPSALQAKASHEAAESASAEEATRAQSLSREIGTLQARIGELQAQLALAQAAGRDSRIEIGAGLLTPKVIVRFRDYSSVVEVDASLARALGATVASAERVMLRGRTDAFTWSAGSADLARSRAVAVKRLLIAQGVAPERIRVFYRGAGAFAVSNATVAGKAANRRVEIDMVKG